MHGLTKVEVVGEEVEEAVVAEWVTEEEKVEVGVVGLVEGAGEVVEWEIVGGEGQVDHLKVWKVEG